MDSNGYPNHGGNTSIKMSKETAQSSLYVSNSHVVDKNMANYTALLLLWLSYKAVFHTKMVVLGE